MNSPIKTQPNLSEQIDYLHTQAVKKHKQGELASAVDFYLQSIKVDRKQPPWIYGNAITLLNQLGKVNEALEIGKIALKVDANSDEILRALGSIYKSNGNFLNSIKFYQQAIEINHSQPIWVYEHLIESLIQQNDLSQALKYGTLGTKINPESCWLKYHLGNIFFEQERWSKACELYIQILEVEPDFLNVADKLNEATSYQANQVLNVDAQVSNIAPEKNSQSNLEELESTVVNSGSSFVAEITQVSLGGFIQGWAIDNFNPEETLEIKVIVDRQTIGIVKAEQKVVVTTKQNLRGIPKEFKLLIPATLLDDQEHQFELIYLKDKQSTTTHFKVPRRGVGRIIKCQNNCISGWALADGHTKSSANLDVYIDNIFYTEIQANKSQKNLLQDGLGNGNNGFEIFLPLLQEKKSYQIGVFFQGTKNHLQKSPIYLEYKNSSTPTQSLFLAGVDSVSTGGILNAWAIDSVNLNSQLKIKIYADGNPIGVVKATEDYPLVGGLCTATPKKLQIQLPYTLLDDREHQFELFLLDKKQNEAQSIKSRIIVPRQNIGRIDGWNDNCVTGWAIPEGHIGAAMLDVYIDGTFYQEIKANTSRKDLLKYNLGNGNNGFEFALPLPPENKETYKIDIFFKGTPQKLQRSPINISFALESESLYKQQKGRFSLLYRGKKNLLHRNLTIVIPVFNAYEELCLCLKSVFKYTSLKAKLVIINDCSTDQRILELLVWAGSHPNVTVMYNEENIGYTRTINRGINFAENDDIVLLNSDTVVGPHWLQNLSSAVYHQPDIATATAISDNSGAFSVPDVGRANDFPLWLEKEEMVRAVSQNSKIVYPETPTGSGFCIYIRREVFQEIGIFDEINFPRGYGEENDFCMRAVRAGWRNIVDDRTLVYHVRSASFRDEKTSLYDTGRNVVDERYPDYRGRVGVFVHSPQMNVMRYGVRKLIEGKWSTPVYQPRQRILYVISTQTGGTPQTNQDLMNGLSDRYHPLVLRCSATEIFLYDTRNEEDVACETVQLQSPITLTAHQSVEYEDIVGDWLIKYSIEILHVRHIAWHSLSLCRVAKRLGITVIFSFHDFYAVCPTVNLLDENQVFCGGNCTNTAADCEVPLWKKHNHIRRLKHSFINAWREMIADMLPYADAFVTTSASTKKLLEDIYPELKQRDFAVIPHGRDFRQLTNKGNAFSVSYPLDSEPLRILFPGNIQSAKGANLIAQIKALDIENRLELHFLGTKADVLDAQVGTYHGRYQRENFGQLVSQIKPHYIGVFSIWPETYCHTLTESWASGVPVIAIALGAVKERIEQHGGGWLIEPSLKAQSIYAKLLQIAADNEAYMSKVEEVNRWQLSYGRQNTIATMAQKYHHLYQRVVQSSLPFAKHFASKSQYIKVGVFVHRNANNQSNPSTHIRVLEWLKCHAVAQKIHFQFIDIDSFLYDRLNTLEIDLVLVQRNIIKSYLAERFIQQCRERNLPIVWEIDDDLINVPVAKDPAGVYAQTAMGIKAIAQAATTVIVSTQPLKAKMSQYNSNIVVIPNVIPEYAWFRPIEAKALNQAEGEENVAEEIKILYMGNPTHGEDLALVKPVFEQLAKEGYPHKLYVIGGETPTQKNESTWYKRIDIPSQCRHYPQFIDWFRSIANNFSLAIAPLVETEFNQCKSPLKFLQYSAAALPSISSNCTPYKEVVESGVNGFLVDNSEAAWRQALIKSINNHQELDKVAANAQKLILDRYLMSHYAETYISIFQKSLAGS